MRIAMKAALLSLFIAPCSVLAFPVGGYFQQGVNVINTSPQAIMITDAAVPELQNKQVDAGYSLKATFASDQLTNGAGQSFSHTVSIHSAADYSLICTVQSSISLSANGMDVNKPSSTNESRCKTTNAISYSNSGMVIGMEITVA
jgi:hypothetical protein